MTTTQYYFRTLLLCFLIGFFLPINWVLYIAIVFFVATYFIADKGLKASFKIFASTIVIMFLFSTVGTKLLMATAMIDTRADSACSSGFSQEQIVLGEPPSDLLFSVVKYQSTTLSRIISFPRKYCDRDTLEHVLATETRTITSVLPYYIVLLILAHGISFAIFRSRNKVIVV